MKRKILFTLIAVILAVSLVFGFTACFGNCDGFGDNTPPGNDIMQPDPDPDPDPEPDPDPDPEPDPEPEPEQPGDDVEEGYEGLLYTLSDDGKYYIVSGITPDPVEEVTVPSVHNDLPVRSIGYMAFYNNAYISTVKLPDSLTTIDTGAFAFCSRLTEIVIPDSVTEVGNAAFGACTSLTEIVIPDSVTDIKEAVFGECTSLTEIKLPENIETISSMMFYGCTALTDVIIPDSVTSIGEDAFRGCDSLNSIDMNEVYLDKEAFYGCASLESVSIAVCDGIAGKVFYECKALKNVWIGECSGEIGEYAFYECEALETIDIPEGITSIGVSAFSFCCSLGSVKLPDSLEKICNNAFKSCSSLLSIKVPSNVSVIEFAAFDNCYRLVEVYNYSPLDISAGSENYGGIAKYALRAVDTDSESRVCITEDEYAFYVDERADEYWLIDYTGDKTELELPDSCNGKNYKIFGSALSNKDIVSVTVPKGVTYIGDNAFSSCGKLAAVKMSEGITYIGSMAFSYCKSLTSIELPEGISAVNELLFFDCNSLVCITIPSSVTSIDEDAFSGISKVIELYNFSSVKILNNLEGQDFKDALYVDAMHIYSSADEESKLSMTDDGYIVYKNTETGKYYLVGYTGDSVELTLPENIDGYAYEIYKYAFYATDIVKVTIPEGVTAINNEAFSSCYELTDAVISDSVKKIGDYAFDGCYSLETMILGKGLTELGLNSIVCANEQIIYYRGSAEDWENVSYDRFAGDMMFIEEMLYIYSETAPQTDGYYWHYDIDGQTPVLW